MKNENTIKVLKIEPGKMPYEKEMVNDLEGIQAEVDGMFECVYLDNNCIAVVNEEGKLNGNSYYVYVSGMMLVWCLSSNFHIDVTFLLL